MNAPLRILAQDGVPGPPVLTLSLRVSVTDRCNFACGYCRPGALSPFIPSERVLRVADYQRIARALRLRATPPLLHKIRFTGGEPLLRPDFHAIAQAFHQALPSATLALTTNGQLLGARLGALQAAGVSRATVHVDTLRPDRYRRLMGGADLAGVLRNIAAAQRVLQEVKLNCVVQRGENDDEIVDLLDWSARTGVQVRFIELMNTGSAASYTQQAFFSGADIVDVVRRARGVRALPRARKADPAALWSTDAGVQFGVIASDTEAFCGACDRLRLNAEGRLRGCLYQADGVSLAAALHGGATDGQLSTLIDGAILDKRSFHPGVAAPQRGFSMADVGG